MIQAAGCQSRDRIDISRWVRIYPAASIVHLPGKTASLPVVVRNVSSQRLTEVKLEVKTACCQAEVVPSAIPGINPGDRRTFAVTLTRKPGTDPKQRDPVYLTVRGDGLPVPAGMDLMVDPSVARGGTWMDVGQVKLIPRDDARTMYYLLAGAPLLILIGYLLWRFSRTPRRKEEE